MLELVAVTLLSLPVAPRQELPREDVRFPSGDLQLAGDLIRPPGAQGRLPAVVVLQGSGDSDRSNAWSRAIAEVFAEHGLVALLTDKRGCGASQGDWHDAGFEELADDALAGVAFLRSLPDVEPDAVGVVGLSQGGWVAPIAAVRSPDVAFLVSVSCAAVGFAEQVSAEMANTARQAGLSEAGVAAVMDLHRAAGRFALTGEWESYARVRERCLATEARPVIEGFPDTVDHPQWRFVRHVILFDPMPYWATVQQPALVLFGEEDEQDNVPVEESVRRLEHAFGVAGKEDATLVVIPGAGHGFVDRERSRLMPEFVTTIREWLDETL